MYFILYSIKINFQVAGEPQILEVELAKLKVLVNDIAAHQASIDTLNDAGAHIVQHGKTNIHLKCFNIKLTFLCIFLH